MICDLMMPRVSGMDLHQWVVDHRPELAERMLFVTGGVFTPRAKAFLARVKNPKFDKPFDEEAIRDAVRAIISSITPKLA